MKSAYDNIMISTAYRLLRIVPETYTYRIHTVSNRSIYRACTKNNKVFSQMNHIRDNTVAMTGSRRIQYILLVRVMNTV